MSRFAGGCCGDNADINTGFALGPEKICFDTRIITAHGGGPSRPIDVTRAKLKIDLSRFFSATENPAGQPAGSIIAIMAKDATGAKNSAVFRLRLSGDRLDNFRQAVLLFNLLQALADGIFDKKLLRKTDIEGIDDQQEDDGEG